VSDQEPHDESDCVATYLNVMPGLPSPGGTLMSKRCSCKKDSSMRGGSSKHFVERDHTFRCLAMRFPCGSYTTLVLYNLSPSRSGMEPASWHMR